MGILKIGILDKTSNLTTTIATNIVSNKNSVLLKILTDGNIYRYFGISIIVIIFLYEIVQIFSDNEMFKVRARILSILASLAILIFFFIYCLINYII